MGSDQDVLIIGGGVIGVCIAYELAKKGASVTIVMDEGVIVADGKTKEILQDEKFLNEHGLEKP